MSSMATINQQQQCGASPRQCFDSPCSQFYIFDTRSTPGGRCGRARDAALGGLSVWLLALLLFVGADAAAPVLRAMLLLLSYVRHLKVIMMCELTPPSEPRRAAGQP